MNEQEEQVDASTYPFLAHANPRPGQLEMIQDGIKALQNGGYHLAAAPTGIGKTAASLAAALEVASQQPQKKTVFFLTSRQTQHRMLWIPFAVSTSEERARCPFDWSTWSVKPACASNPSPKNPRWCSPSCAAKPEKHVRASRGSHRHPG